MKLKSKFFIKCTAIIITVVVIILFSLERNNGNVDWIKELNYKKEEIHDMSIGLINPCPTIPVELDDKKINIEFDTGNTEGISITSAIKEKVDYEVTGKIISKNADGTYRGNGEKSTIYLDTGSSRSFINLGDNNKDTSADVKLGDKKYKFQRLRNNDIGFTEKFNYPLRLAMNSDLLKGNHFVITIDRIQNNIIISQN